MKKTVKVLCSCLLVLSILSVYPITAFAYEYGTPDLSAMVDVKKNGFQEIRSISSEDINRIRNSKSIAYRNKSDTEKLKELFSALNFELNDAQFEKISECVELSHMGSVSIETTYTKIDEMGKKTNVSAYEALQAKEEERETFLNSPESYAVAASTTAVGPSHGSSPVISSDSYMKQQIVVIYTPNYHGAGTTIGRYVVLGTCEFLKYVLTRAQDAIALMAADFKWDNLGNDFYSLLVSYNEYYYPASTNKLESITPMSEAFGENKATYSMQQGVFFKYRLKSNTTSLSGVHQYTDFAFLICGVGTTTHHHQPDTEITVGLQYVHLKNALSLSASYTWGSGFSLNVSGINLPIYYDMTYKWYYWNDYYA